MKPNYCFYFLAIIFFAISCTSTKRSSWQYIDTAIPSTTPQIFAKDFISKTDVSEYGSVFSKDGNEFYYGVDTAGKSEIRYTQYAKGQWTPPTPLMVHPTYSYNDPFLSPSEDRLYYISDMPRNETDTIKDIDIWYSEKTKQGWSTPINAGEKINSNRNEYYISFTREGTLYFASNKNSAPKRKRDFDIYYAPYSNGKFLEPIKASDAINTNRYEADVFIAPDESYIIFCSARRTGFGSGDLYISFKDAKGDWTKAKNMGAPINSKNHELCPFVTHDGKFLFYTSNQDIYWVSTSIFDTFRE